MAKGAANEKDLGALHSKLARVFTSVLDRYERRMDLSNIDTSNLEDELIEKLLEADLDPSPAMLGAVSKFLKDNEILLDSEEVNELSDMERRLANKRKNRSNVVSLDKLATDVN